MDDQTKKNLPIYQKLDNGKYLNTYTGEELRVCKQWDPKTETWLDWDNRCKNTVAMYEPVDFRVFRICRNCM